MFADGIILSFTGKIEAFQRTVQSIMDDLNKFVTFLDTNVKKILVCGGFICGEFGKPFHSSYVDLRWQITLRRLSDCASGPHCNDDIYCISHSTDIFLFLADPFLVNALQWIIIK